MALLFTASLINYFDRATISFALPLISKELHLGPEAKGVLLSAFFWSYAVMQIPMGVLADRMNLPLAAGLSRSCLAGPDALPGYGPQDAHRVSHVNQHRREAIYLPGGSKIVSLLFRPAERGLPCGLFDAARAQAHSHRACWCNGCAATPAGAYLLGRETSALVWILPWLIVTPRQLRGNPEATAVADRSNKCPTFHSWRRIEICLASAWGFSASTTTGISSSTGFPTILVTARGLTILRAGIYAALPYLVFGASEPIGGWIADRLVRAGWNETHARKGVITFAFLTGLLLIPAARVNSPGAAVALIVGGCLVGLATGNLLVILQSCARGRESSLWTGVYNP